MSTPPLTDQRVNTDGTRSDRAPLTWRDLPKSILVWVLPLMGTGLVVALGMVNELRESRLARMDEDGKEIRREVPMLRQDVNDLKWRMQQHLTLDEEYRQERKAMLKSLGDIRDEVLRLGLVDALARGDDRAARRLSGKLRAIENAAPRPNDEGENP